MAVANALPRIPRTEGLCPEHIHLRGRPDTAAVLVDQFGCAHQLRETTVVGREPGDGGLAVLESSVSRRHAELRCERGTWQVRDLGSTNGTYIDGQRVDDAHAVADGQLVVVGDVAFAFLADGSTALARTVTESIRATATLPVSPDDRAVRLAAPSGGGGGFIEYGDERAQLGTSQFALLVVLARRYLAEAELPDDVRGFVRSSELLGEIPWETAHPSDNHLKQLVRRVRRALERIGLSDVIESRQRLGYRLLAQPDIAAE